MKTASAFTITATAKHLSFEKKDFSSVTFIDKVTSSFQVLTPKPYVWSNKTKNIHLPEEQEIRKTANANLVAAPIFQCC